MEYVEPIRDKSEIEAMKKQLAKSSERDYVMFTVGINTSFRISDLLSLTVAQAREQTHINLKAKKTGKDAVIAIGNISELIDDYTQGLADDEYLFKGQKSAKLEVDGLHYEWHETRVTESGKTLVTDKIWQPTDLQPDSKGYLPISRVQAWRILNNAADKVGISYNFGTHTMRKTFAYQYYLLTHDVATLMRVLGHSSEHQTLEYIGINQDVVDLKMASFRL